MYCAPETGLRTLSPECSRPMATKAAMGIQRPSILPGSVDAAEAWNTAMHTILFWARVGSGGCGDQGIKAEPCMQCQDTVLITIGHTEGGAALFGGRVRYQCTALLTSWPALPGR